MRNTVPIEVSGASAHPPMVEFGRSAEDFPVARVGDTAFAMLPAGDGRHFLATGWRLTRPLEDWTRRDFFGHCGLVVDETAFRALVNDNAEHQREVAALGRREVIVQVNTPWGPSQGATVYAEGVLFHSTASHGGFHLTPRRNIQPCIGQRASMKRTRNGPLSRRDFPICSPPASGGRPTRPSGTIGRKPGKESMGASWNPVNPANGTGRFSNARMPKTGS